METISKQHKSKQINKIKISEDKDVLVLYRTTILTERYEKMEDGSEGALQSEDKNFIDTPHLSDYLPHKDFLDAMKMLRKPVIDICEWKDYKNFDSYGIYGVTFSGEQDTASVIISAGKEIEWSGKVFNFTTPLTPLHDNDKFDGSKKLDEYCANIIKEAWLYVEGKHAENPQLSLQFEGGESVNLQVQK